MLILWIFHLALLIFDGFAFHKFINLHDRDKGYYLFMQLFSTNSVLFLLGKYSDDNADFIFELVSNCFVYSYELFSTHMNKVLIWNETWFYVSGTLCFIMSEKHLNIQYNWATSIIGISNIVSYFFIEDCWYSLLLYAFTLGVFILNKWRYESTLYYPRINNYLIVFHALLLIIGSFFAINFAFKQFFYIEIGTEIMNIINIIAQIYWINLIGFYSWKILRVLMEYEMFISITLIFWFYEICGTSAFGDVLYRKYTSFKERNNKSELKRNKDIFKIIWLYFLILIVTTTIPISKAITIHVLGFTNCIIENLFYFLWAWQIGFILEFPDPYMDINEIPAFFKNLFGVMVHGFLVMRALDILFN